MPLELFDSVAVNDASVRLTDDGYLVADARVARTGVQEYLGSELGRPDLAVVRVYRPAEAVFANDAMRSYAHRPMTNDHRGTITADNWREHSIGQTGGEVVRDGDYVRVPLVLMDRAAVDDWRAGKRELSMGYSAKIEFRDGVTPDGQPYNAVATEMKMNHLALVDRARGGESLKIGDRGAPRNIAPQNPGGSKMPDTRTVMHDGISIETTPQGAQVIEQLQTKLADMRTAADTARTAHQTALADRDSQVTKLTAERDAALGKVLTDAQIDKLVAERADLLATAKSLNDADYTGKSAGEIKRAVVVAKLGDAAVAGKDDAYVAARFDILAEDAKASNGDPVVRAMGDAASRARQPQDNGHAARMDRLQNAWKSQGSKA